MIIGGAKRGLSLQTPSGSQPVSGKVRQLVFEKLGGKIKGSRVADLYAGSGSY